MSFSFLSAQGWELGFQSGNWSVSGSESSDVLTSFGPANRRNVSTSFDGSIFLHKEKGNRYLQWNFNTGYTGRSENTTGMQNPILEKQTYRFQAWNAQVGLEMGRIFPVGKKVRLMLGGEIGLRQTLFLKNTTRRPMHFPTTNSYTIETSTGPGFTSLIGNLVGRVDYRIGSRYRLGLALTYGANLSYGSGFSNTEIATFNENRTLLSAEDLSNNERNFGFNNTGLSIPKISLSILLKKPE